MYDVSLLILFFFIYSLLGWIAEFIYMLVKFHWLKRPDFLLTPISPPYGLGALAIVLFIVPYVSNPFWVFILSVLVTSAIEYISHLLIEKLFHIQLWNYSHQRFNLQGRVALENSLWFGILGLLLVYLIHPFVTEYVELISYGAIMWIALAIVIVLVIDIANATGTLARLRGTRFGETLGEVLDYLQEQLDQLLSLRGKPKTTVHRGRTALLKLHRANVRRLHRAYPNARLRRRVPRKQRL